jgi:hypothetical protein
LATGAPWKVYCKAIYVYGGNMISKTFVRDNGVGPTCDVGVVCMTTDGLSLETEFVGGAALNNHLE